MLIIRKAERADLERILYLYAQLHDGEEVIITPAIEKAWRDVESDVNQQLLVLEDGGTVVGTMAFFLMPNLSRQGRPASYAENVVIDKSCRGKGYGHLMIGHAQKLAQEAGAYKFFLMTGTIDRQESADIEERRHRFYRDQGLRDDIKKGFVQYFDENS